MSYDSLTLELALTEKTQADEQFLRDDVAGARELYCKAQETLNGLDLKLANEAQNTSLRLLRADIEYRLLLLRNGYSFWGASQSLTPGIPQVHLARLQQLNRKFRDLDLEIDRFLERARDGQVKASEFYAKAKSLSAEARAQATTEESLSIQQEFAADKQEALDNRIATLRSERVLLENQYASAKAQAQAASAALTRTVTNVATSSVGLPPDTIQNVQQGKWDQAVLAALPAVAQSPGVADAIADLGQNGEVLAGYIREGQALYAHGESAVAQYNEYKANLELAVGTLREPTLANILQVGEAVYAKVDPATRARWDQQIAQAKPGLAAIQLINAAEDGQLADALRSEAERYLAKEANRGADVLFAEARRYVENARLDVDDYQRQLLGKAASLTLSDQDAARVIDAVARNWSDALLQRLPATARSQLVAATGSASEQDLKTKLASSGLTAIDTLARVQNGELVIYNRPTNPRAVIARMPLNSVSQIVATPITRASQTANLELERTLQTLNKAEGALRGVLIRSLPATATSAALTDYLEPRSQSIASLEAARERQEAAWNEIVTRLPQSTIARTVQKISAAKAGGLAIEQITARQESDSQAQATDYAQNGPAPAQPQASGGGGRAEEAVAKMALNYFAPGAGVALDVVASFSSFNEAVARAERYAKALQNNLGEELQVESLVNEARLRQVVLSKEREIAGIMRISANAQFEIYQSAVAQVSDNVAADRARSALRRPLTFWLAERQRQEFDALNYSLALWLGEPESPRGVISRLVQGDPQNLRLALDSEIHLFNWLNRDIESSRADVAGVRAHWDQMTELALQACEKLGCAPGSSRLGQAARTDAFPVTSILAPGQLEALKRWQKSRGRERFTATLIVSPDNKIFPANLSNLRIIDVRIGESNPGGQANATSLNQIQLTHPGVGYVYLDGAYRRDVLKTVSGRSFKPHQDFDPDELDIRWDVRPKTRPFEGYPAYSVWLLTFEPYKENYRVDPEKIMFRFAYHFANETPVTEADLIRGSLANAPDFPANELFTYLATWKNNAQLQPTSTASGPLTVKVPSDGSAVLPAAWASLLTADPPRIAPCGSTTESQTSGGAATSSPPSTPPTVVQVCKPDADIRRILLTYYMDRLKPGARASVARQQARVRAVSIKQEYCSAPTKVALGGRS